MATLTQTIFDIHRAGEALGLQLERLHGCKRQLHDKLRLCETWQERATLHAEMCLVDDFILRNAAFFKATE